MADDLKGWFEKKLESGEADIAEEGDQLELPEPSMPSKKTVEMRRCGPLVKTHGGKVIVMPRREDPAA